MNNITRTLTNLFLYTRYPSCIERTAVATYCGSYTTFCLHFAVLFYYFFVMSMCFQRCLERGTVSIEIGNREREWWWCYMKPKWWWWWFVPCSNKKKEQSVAHAVAVRQTRAQNQFMNEKFSTNVTMTSYMCLNF